MNTTSKMTPAYVLSGHTMALGVVRSLGEKGVPVILLHHDPRSMAQVSRYVTRSVETPPPENSEDEFITSLMDCARRFGHGVVFPVSDETVVAVSRHKRRLEERLTIACPDWDVVERYIDKKKTYALAEESGVAAPRTFLPASVDEIGECAESLGFPCLMKPSQSHLFFERFQRKMIPVDNAGQMVAVYLEAAKAGLEVMAQEIIPGGDDDVVNYNAYFHNGEPLAEFTAAHVRNAPPWWGSPRVAVSEDIPEVIEPGRKIMRALGINGYACTEFKRDMRSGAFALMDVNGRHNLSTLLAVRCGIDFPWLEYRHLAYGEVPARQGFESGVYWIDIPRDLGYSFKYMGREGCSLRQYIRPYVSRHVFAILDRKDPRPFMKRCSYLAGQMLRKLAPRLRVRRSASSEKVAAAGRAA